jgi:heme/copper-type cytochrome/quinol oxidase subunit 3
MGIPSELRDVWVSKRNYFLIASPDEERKLLRTKICTSGNWALILSYFTTFIIITSLHASHIIGSLVLLIINLSLF